MKNFCRLHLSIGLPNSRAKELQERLKRGKTYLKTDYKLHITSESRCGDHCRMYALSDSETEFQEKCLHEHDVTCDRCEELESTLTAIEVAVSSEKGQLRYNFLLLQTGNQKCRLSLKTCKTSLPLQTFS